MIERTSKLIPRKLVILVHVLHVAESQDIQGPLVAVLLQVPDLHPEGVRPVDFRRASDHNAALVLALDETRDILTKVIALRRNEAEQAEAHE